MTGKQSDTARPYGSSYQVERNRPDDRPGDAGIAAPPPSSTPVGQAYPFEPALVELEGVIEEQSRFGAPNFGETPKIDKKVRVYILRLREPITAGTPDATSEENDAPVTGVTELQVSPENAAEFTGRMGRTVTVRGALSKQLLPYDFYPIVLRQARLK